MLLVSGFASVLITTLRLLGHRGGEEKENKIYLFRSSRDPRARREPPFSLGFRSLGAAMSLSWVGGGSGIRATLRLSMTKRRCFEMPFGLNAVSHSARWIVRL